MSTAHARTASASAVVAAWLLAGCSGPSASPTLAVTPSATGTPKPDAVTVTDVDTGTTVTVHTGQQLRVVLHSTYWRIIGSSDAGVLRLDQAPAVSPAPGCVPGGGCGTVTATFTGQLPGRATVAATRTSCGEALTCTGAAGSFTVSVVVGA